MYKKVWLCAVLALVLLFSGCAAPGEDYRPLPLPVPQVSYRTYTVGYTQMIRQIDDAGRLVSYQSGTERFFAVEYRGLSRTLLKDGDKVNVYVGESTYIGVAVPGEDDSVRIIRIDGMPDYYAAFVGTNVKFDGVLDIKENVIAVPRAYVKKTQGDNGYVRVLVKNEKGYDEKKRVAVKLGSETAESIEILYGLKTGDRVIID